MELIKSPLNYTGNKFRILSQIQPYFPKEIGTMVDLFCGGATVGINTKCEKIIFIDNDPNVIGLLKFLAKIPFDNLIKELEVLIKKYGLSYSAQDGYSFFKKQITDSNFNNGLKQYNSKGYYELRAYYVALCPNCHRKIHFAEDNERKHLINLIYRHRQASLLADGLPIDIKTLYKYYRINS